MHNNNNEFKGYSLFNDVEEKDTQRYNRARILVNIMEDHSDAKRNVNLTGLMLCKGYFDLIEPEERDVILEETKKLLEKKGIII